MSRPCPCNRLYGSTRIQSILFATGSFIVPSVFVGSRQQKAQFSRTFFSFDSGTIHASTAAVRKKSECDVSHWSRVTSHNNSISGPSLILFRVVKRRNVVNPPFVRLTTLHVCRNGKRPKSAAATARLAPSFRGTLLNSTSNLRSATHLSLHAKDAQ